MAREGGLRAIVVGAVALVVGLAVGGIPARGEVRALEKKVEDLEDRPCVGQGLGQEIARAFSDRPWAPDEPPAVAPAARVEPAPVAEPDPGERGFHVTIGGEAAPDAPVDAAETLQAARDAMAARQRQAFAALEDQAGPSDEQMADIEAAVQVMNEELRTLAADFVETVRAGDVERRDAMVFAANTLDVLIEADDALFDALTPEQREALEDEALDPMAYVDPALLDVFQALEGLE